MSFRQPFKLVFALLLVAPRPATAQDASVDAESESEVLTVLEDAPVASSRAAAMAGAIVTIADDVDAAFHNPAGIGGLGWGKQKVPLIRKLYFPNFSLAGNNRSAGLIQDIRKEGAANDASIGQAMVEAHAGERQYARAGVIAGVVFGRAMLLPFTDAQVAAVSQAAEGEESDLIDLRYRTLTGAGVGFSAQDAEGVFSIGYFGYTAQRSATEGAFAFDVISDKTARTDAFDEATTKSSATGHNAGFIWRLAKKAKPTLGVALKNIGDTTYKATGDGDDLVQRQDLTIGFSLSPEIGRHGVLNFVLAADRLEHDELSFTEKYRTGVELLFGGLGSYATLALRAGYHDAGASAGLGLNLGLVGLEASTYGVDIGAGNEKVIERRFTGTLFVNVAEF